MALNRNLYFWFIDCGQGDGTFIKFPDTNQAGDGETMLVDFGTTKGDAISGETIGFFNTVQSIKDVTFQNISQIDHLIITHPDRDHYNLLRHLIDNGYRFNHIYFSGDVSDYRNGGNLSNGMNFLNWLRGQVTNGVATQVNGILPAINTNQWTRIIAGGILGGIGGMRTNTLSIVLKIEYARKSVMLAADATYLTETAILRGVQNNPNILKSHILKVGHHGSARTSTSKEWAQAVSPECIFISADRTGTSGGTGGTRTGFRLPQQAAIDTILQFSAGPIKSNPNDINPPLFHTYVAYYDENTSTAMEFGRSRSIRNFRGERNAVVADVLIDQTIKPSKKRKQGSDDPKLNKPYNSYYEIKTQQMIYTNIYKLDWDSEKADTEKADMGTHTCLKVDVNGNYTILPWVGDKFYEFSRQEEDVFMAVEYFQPPDEEAKEPPSKKQRKGNV